MNSNLIKLAYRLSRTSRARQSRNKVASAKSYMAKTAEAAQAIRVFRALEKDAGVLDFIAAHPFAVGGGALGLAGGATGLAFKKKKPKWHDYLTYLGGGTALGAGGGALIDYLLRDKVLARKEWNAEDMQKDVERHRNSTKNQYTDEQADHLRALAEAEVAQSHANARQRDVAAHGNSLKNQYSDDDPTLAFITGQADPGRAKMIANDSYLGRLKWLSSDKGQGDMALLRRLQSNEAKDLVKAVDAYRDLSPSMSEYDAKNIFQAPKGWTDKLPFEMTE